MSKMTVQAIKLTDDIESIKVVYEKNGKLYVRNGSDGFAKGIISRTGLSALGKWGFYKVEEPYPQFRDAEELINGLDKFQMDSQGKVKYYG